jgi:hypothetical protein
MCKPDTETDAVVLEMNCQDKEESSSSENEHDDEDYLFATTTSTTHLFNPYAEKKFSCKRLCKKICLYTLFTIGTVCFFGAYMLPAPLTYLLEKDDLTFNITTDFNSTIHDTTVLYKVSFAVNNNTTQ